jgi:ADP-ribose pyrophosphatase YjhB (NUDIX family)
MKNDLHEIQKQILKKLVHNKELRFNDLLWEEVESEHMNYHLKKLIELNLVTKKENVYTLTDWGKEFTNRIDDETSKLEIQPKTGILIRGVRKNEKGEVENLLMKRLKQPYFGKVGRLTGKVRYGETLEEATRRELHEETGLSAHTVVLECIYHKLRKREDGTTVQDVIFYQFLVKDFYGDFVEKTPFQENFFVTEKNFGNGNYNMFDDFVFEGSLTPKKLSFREEIKLAEGF